ncbi:MAG TPA: carboxymuconolactone decarboxylase family protein [Steroidobacteraceae bacterium]|jgi:alkyl hydroperoxide reductase subunit D|nr:carboxymuconolactone decarboxylase family protein [Steroidobacteraceae bacterium]
MDTLERIRAGLPDYARDLKLNLGSVLSTGGAPGLSERQIWAVALAAAIAARNVTFAQAIEAASLEHLDGAHVTAARAAAAIMGMNNIYYRFLHLVEDGEYQRLPARLRMNVLGAPGIDKLDFELLSLAVSAINGCGLCISSHEKQLRGHGVTREAIQSAVRIAAVVHAVAGVHEHQHPPGDGAGDVHAATRVGASMEA